MYIRFNGFEEVYVGKVKRYGENVVYIESPTIMTSGFHIYLDAACTADLGGNTYDNFVTVYKNDGLDLDNKLTVTGLYLSNDGSTYVPPTPTPEPTPYIPTLEEEKETKIKEMNEIQQEIIAYGVSVTLSNGDTERFTLTSNDQLSLVELNSMVITDLAAGKTDGLYPWHHADHSQGCKYYNAADMTKIAQKALEYVTYHVTYYRDLQIYINALSTIEEVQDITYGVWIPEEYQSEVLKDLLNQITENENNN